MDMTPFHCSNCNKLLGMIDGKAEIKCPRCKTINEFYEKLEPYEPKPGDCNPEFKLGEVTTIYK